MSAVHHRKLLVVKQFGIVVSCELVSHSSTRSAVLNSCCSSCGGCGGLADKKIIDFQIPASFRQLSPAVVKVGETVEVMAPQGVLLTLSSVVYFLPVLLMLFFSVCGDLLFPSSEVIVALSAVFGLGLGLGTIVLFRPALRSYIMKRLTVRSGFNNPRLL